MSPQTFYVDLAATTEAVKDFSLSVNLTGGVGVSVVNSTDKMAEELIYMSVVNVVLEYLFNRSAKKNIPPSHKPLILELVYLYSYIPINTSSNYKMLG